MRELRPEYYSDTQDRKSYELEAAVFDHFLNSLTSRNEHHDFEIFCRKLCERTIAPNLRPATGPEGGGDGKADTETTPVAEEISDMWYVGEPNAGKEKWGFAFSAKADWAPKVKSDVKGLIETGRPYDRIICVTSQYAKSKDRLDLEQKLSTEYGVPIIIHDRAWIIDEIIAKDKVDIAFNYLRVGREIDNPQQLGPVDYSRTRQLDELEASLKDPANYTGMERQMVVEALLAAKLSRGLAKHRTAPKRTGGSHERSGSPTSTAVSAKSWRPATNSSGRPSGGSTTSNSSTTATTSSRTWRSPATTLWTSSSRRTSCRTCSTPC